MTQLVITPEADDDVDRIVADLALASGWRTVETYLENFDRLYDRLVDFPQSGAPRPKLGHDIRVGLVAPYVIVYRYDHEPDRITVLRILHGARKITRKLLK